MAIPHSPTVIRILIAEDQEMISEALADSLSKHEHLKVVGRVPHGEAALAYLEAHANEVDLILMDLFMTEKKGAEPDGLQTAKEIMRRYPPGRGKEIKILIISFMIKGLYIYQAYLNGVDGYLPKEKSGKELRTAIEEVMAGKRYFRGEVRDHMDNYTLDNKSHLQAVTLTPTEMRVLEFVAKGHATKVIADMMGISTTTVDTHRKSIMGKFKANNAAEIVSLGYQMGFLKVK